MAGGTGTDFSVFDAAEVSVTDAVADGSTTITSATAAFATTHVDNILYLAGGSGTLAATRRHVISRTSATAIVVDAVVAAGTGVTLNLGGALSHPNQLPAVMIGSNKAFVKGSYTSTATITFTQAVSVTAAVPFSRLIGYTTTRGDSGRFTITLSTNAGLTGLSFTGTGWNVENAQVDCATLGTSNGINLQSTGAGAINCKVANFTGYGILLNGSAITVSSCEVTGGTSAATNGAVWGAATAPSVVHSHVHDNACPGINFSATYGRVEDNLIVNNAGASSDGVRLAHAYGVLITVVRNTIYGSGRHGINNTGTFGPTDATRNILAGNGGYGLVAAAAAGVAARPAADGNAYWNNTSGTRSNADDTTVNPQNGVAPYINTYDVLLTADPFVSKATGDFRLNTAAGGGAACRGVGIPQSWPGNTPTLSYPDLGAVQHADAGGGGGGGGLIGGGNLSGGLQ